MQFWFKWICVAFAGASGVWGETISVNFYNGNVLGAIDTHVFPGIIADSNWANVVYTAGSTGGVSNVAESMMDVAWTTTAQVTLGANGWPGRHALGVNNSDSKTITLSDIPFDRYYLVVYVNGYLGANLSIGSVAVASATKYYTATDVVNMIESADTDFSDGADEGGYLTFGSESRPLAGSSVMIELQRLGGTATGIGAIQVVRVEAASTLGLFVVHSAVLP